MKILKDTQHKDWVGMFKGWTSLFLTSRISSKREIKNQISSTMILETGLGETGVKFISGHHH
jgi:hypothetical protein